MAVFTENDVGRLDWQILRISSVSLYMKQSLLDEALDWFSSQKYILSKIDCSDWSKFRSQMSNILKFQENFGYTEWTGNLDALNDAFKQLNVPEKTGAVFCFQGYHHLNSYNGEIATGVLDIFERHSRNNLLYGKKLIALVQSDDPRLTFAPIGAGSACWNEKEWLNKNRGL